jgi:NIMA-interacting peptidyl-prolyl cis-trans isomerase 1
MRKAPAGESKKLPEDWEERHSRTHNKSYYYNKITGVKQWEDPTLEHAGEVRVRHLLVKHVNSRRPSSWKQVGFLYGVALYVLSL